METESQRRTRKRNCSLFFFSLSLFARIEQDSKLLTMPIPQLSPPMSFSDPSTWEQMFQELIQEEKPRAKWTLQLDKNILPDDLTKGWRQYQQAGVGRWVGVGQRRIATANLLLQKKKKKKNKCYWVGPPVFCGYGAGWGPLDANPPPCLTQEVFLSYQVYLI